MKLPFFRKQLIKKKNKTCEEQPPEQKQVSYPGIVFHLVKEKHGKEESRSGLERTHKCPCDGGYSLLLWE